MDKKKKWPRFLRFHVAVRVPHFLIFFYRHDAYFESKDYKVSGGRTDCWQENTSKVAGGQRDEAVLVDCCALAEELGLISALSFDKKENNKYIPVSRRHHTLAPKKKATTRTYMIE